MNLRKYLNNQNWNIGFADITPERLVSKRRLPKIYWLKHKYRDRFFADPFILYADDKTIIIFAEEYEFKPGSKGVIVKLTVDRSNYKLLERKLILKLDTHLSYPVIERKGSRFFLSPENSEGDSLKSYIYNPETDEIKTSHILADSPLTDATPLEFNGERYLIATKLPDSCEDAFLYKFDIERHKYYQLGDSPIVTGRMSSRMGGSFFTVNGRIFRPAQNCASGYGSSLTIFEIESVYPEYVETPRFELKPNSWRYNLGLHTLNFSPDRQTAVIDSYGYLYPVAGRILMSLYKVKHSIYG